MSATPLDGATERVTAPDGATVRVPAPDGATAREASPNGAVSVPTDAPAAPMRVISGSPTDAELAAVHSVIMAVLAEQAARGAELLDPPVDRWRAGARAMRGPISPGPGAWIASNGMRGC